MYFMGIDGGGSTLRVVITDADLYPVVEIKAESANPSSIGQAVATERIQSAMQQALQTASLKASQIQGVAAGIAGTSTSAFDDWFQDTLTQVLPDAQITRSSDVEIALVGATGREFGLMALAGTGSVAYGINAAGDRLQMGG
ncbi:MAG: BadF/BadG/BcrA/BcrD ATPase family protein, partial [Aggregatilineales bacterium]